MQKNYTENELELPALWFTSAEWADGTAYRVLREQYDARCRELDDEPVTPQQKLVFEQGLSPIQACRKAMRGENV